MKKLYTTLMLAAAVLLLSACGASRKTQVQRLPVMGQLEWSKQLQKADKDFVVELSGLCLSKDKDFLWGVGTTAICTRSTSTALLRTTGITRPIWKASPWTLPPGTCIWT